MQRSTRKALIASLSAVVFASALGCVVSNASASERVPEAAGPALDEMVRSSVPQWNFPRANSNDPCWPQPAFDPTGAPAAGVEPHNWPDSDSGCAPHGAPFPTYYTARVCDPAGNNDVRISFTIYQALDAFQPSGHRHDFERVIVKWMRDGDTWHRDTLYLSSHKTFHARPWSEVRSFAADRATAGYGLPLPRVFVGFASHAMFNDEGGLKDVLSSYTDLEYRHGDYPVWADQGGDLVEVAPGGDLYQRFADNAAAWGSATSNPADVADKLCDQLPG